MRIVAGKHKGRRIDARKSASIRPTSDFARQAIFNILMHGDGPPIEGASVLDLCCGTGAFGLEALSRGAAWVTFVDSSKESLAVARGNLERFGETANAQCLLADAGRLPAASRRHHIVFLDPPYGSGVIPGALESARTGGWLAENARIILERDQKEPLSLPAGFASLDQRRYGRALVEIVASHDFL